MIATRLRGTGWIRVGVIGLSVVALIGLLWLYATLGMRSPMMDPYENELFVGEGAMLERIAQVSPELNYMSDEGIFEPGIISWRTSRVRASLSVEEEDSTEGLAVPYDLDFLGEYQLILPYSGLNTVEVLFPFPQNLETLHDVQFLVDGEEPENVEYGTRGIRWQDEFFSDEEHTITIRYKAEGAYTFTYELPKEQRTNVDVEIAVKGLTGASVPDSSLPPMEIKNSSENERIIWNYSNLIDNRNIQVRLPSEPNFSQRIAQIQFELDNLIQASPLVVIATLLALAASFRMSGTQLKIESYLLLGLGLVLFFPLVTFISGLIGVFAGSLAALLITIGLLVAFLRETAGWERVGWRVVLILVVFLGMFALGQLTDWSGVLLTAGGVTLLGVFMVQYAQWQSAREKLEPEQAIEQPEETTPQPTSEPAAENHPTLHCPQCSHSLGEGINFCSNCGYDTKHIQRCKNCGREQFPPAGFEVAYCLGCGESLS